MISAVILTLNEERNIVDCIRSLKSWCRDIVVYDSFSNDRTVQLAEMEGVRVFQRKFDNYAAQRNAALHEVKYPGEWVLMVDADERWDMEIGTVIMTKIRTVDREVDIIHFQRKDIFRGRWLKHNIGASSWFGRLVRYQNVHVEREINEEFHCVGRKEYLSGYRFLHFPFNNGISWWFARHNRYSDMEAIRLLEEHPERWPLLFSRDPVMRRKSMKQLFYHLPGRPLIIFGFVYFLRCGFLDGKAGFHYSVLRMIYEYMIHLKMIEKLEKSEK